LSILDFELGFWILDSAQIKSMIPKFKVLKTLI